jgi:hypothetical protein
LYLRLNQGRGDWSDGGDAVEEKANEIDAGKNIQIQ